MRAGLLNDNCKIFVPVSEKNEVGELVTEYVCACHCKCRVIYGSGNWETENIGEVVHNQIQIFEVRIYHYVDNRDFIEWNGQKYRVVDVKVDNQQRKKVIATQKVND